MTDKQIAHAKRATARAREILKPGDVLFIKRCADTRARVTMTGWDGDWITSKTRDDIHAMHVLRVNGSLRSFQDPKS